MAIGTKSDIAPRFVEVDRLRAIAILLVLVHHFPFIVQLTGFYPLGTAWSGVDLFFVISGFVVTLSLVKSLVPIQGHDPFVQIRANKKAVVGFYLRRILRIVPAVALWVAIPFASSFYLNESGAFGVQNGAPELIAMASLTFNYWINGHLSQFGYIWSIMVEEHFYLLLPLLFMILPSNRMRLYACLAIMAAIAFLVRPYLSEEVAAQNWLAVRFRSHLRFDSLLAGVVLGLLSIEGAMPSLPDSKSFRRFATVLSLGCYALLVAVPFGLPPSYSHGIGFVVLWGVSFVLVALASQNKGFVLEIPVLKSLLSYIGKRSFAIYLCHEWSKHVYQALAFRFFNISRGELAVSESEGIARTVVTFAVLLAVAELTYRFVELPCMRVGGKLSKLVIGASTPQHATVVVEAVEEQSAGAAETAAAKSGAVA